jgi:hypothetical protein
METITVNAKALKEVLQALNGTAHHIRELQAIRNLPGYDCPIKKLTDEYNAAIEINQAQEVAMTRENTINTIFDAARQLRHLPKLNPYLLLSAESMAYELGYAGENAEIIAYVRADQHVFGLEDSGAGEYFVFLPEDMAEQCCRFQSLLDACHCLSDLVLQELYSLWGKLGDIPTVFEGENVDTIEQPFLHFPIGTHRETIWSWFEAQHPEFIVGEVMVGRCKDLSFLN